MKNQFAVFLSFLLFTACGASFFYENKVDIKEEGWAYEEKVDFEFEIKDTTLLYDLFLDIEHTDTYPYQNLYYYVYTQSPTKEKPRKLISTKLANKAGYWHGKCSGENCQLRIVLQENLYFDEIGSYKIGIEQYTRDSLLTGIKTLSLKLKILDLKN